MLLSVKQVAKTSWKVMIFGHLLQAVIGITVTMTAGSSQMRKTFIGGIYSATILAHNSQR